MYQLLTIAIIIAALLLILIVLVLTLVLETVLAVLPSRKANSKVILGVL